MITLITGTPGSGKTLYAVWLMQKELRSGRRLVVDGIRDLSLEHELVDETWVRDWYARCEQNDLIVVDEVQRIWGPTPVSVKATEDIEKLHVHRHKGVDFILITQHPQRMSKTIRDLVGRHVHVRRLFGGRRAMLYEWDHCHNPNTGLRDAVKTVWGYPRDVFNLYTSAEVHTKQKAVIPKALFVLPVAALAAGLLAWKGFLGVSGGFGLKSNSPQSPSTTEGAPADVSRTSSSPKAAVSSTWRVVGRYAMDGKGYVLLADKQGRLRRESSDAFTGEALGTRGVLDGDVVSAWSGVSAAEKQK